jgi:hypothetical protein
LLPTYSHNKIKGIPNAKNMPIVRIGIRNTNNDIPKHNVAKPRAKIQRFVRLSIIYTIQAPLYSIYMTTIWYMGFPLRSGVHLFILYVTTRPIITCYLIWRWLLKSTSSHDDDDDNNDLAYRQIENNMSESFKQMVQNTLHPSEVAKVILQAVMVDNPDFRYVVGKDAAMILEARNMSDREFQNFMKKKFNLQNIIS